MLSPPGCHAFACESMCWSLCCPVMDGDTLFHRKRCKRYDVPGHAHYLTFSCYRRQPFLSRDLPREWLMEAIVKARQEAGFDLWAYVIMPEHAHAVIWPHAGVHISDILRAVKLPVAKRALIWAQREDAALLEAMRHGGPGGTVAHRFWQRGGGYDRNLWSASEVHEKIAYVHANPVRRGLVARPQDWPWSSWCEWHGADMAGIIDRKTVPRLER